MLHLLTYHRSRDLLSIIWNRTEPEKTVQVSHHVRLFARQRFMYGENGRQGTSACVSSQSIRLNPSLMSSSEASVYRPAPSLSSPRSLHSLGDENKSVLSLMADSRHIFVGGQCQDISVGLFFSILPSVPQQQQVWDKLSYTLKTSLRGHTGSILALELVEHKQWLFSASGRCPVNLSCSVSDFRRRQYC